MTPNQIEDLRDLWESDLQLDGIYPGPIPILNDRPEKTWIWSDLHLGDRGALEAFGRPFEQVDQMNGHLICEWRRRVREDETIICLGDVADREAWRDRRLRVHVRGCPGRKILVLGNHDAELESETLREVGFELCQLALCATDPPLALSHVPLPRPPVGTVNLHGHLHEGIEPTRRHINLVVENTWYKPLKLQAVLLAADDRVVRPLPRR